METLLGKPQGGVGFPLRGELSPEGPISGETGSCHAFPFNVPIL